MAQEKISDEIIMEQIRSTGSVFHLAVSDIAWLKQHGVSDAVILEMQNTANRHAGPDSRRRALYTWPVYAVEPDYRWGYYPYGWGWGSGGCW